MADKQPAARGKGSTGENIPNPGPSLVIGVLGLGHVGLPTALGLAELGWTVVGGDDDAAKATSIRHGQPPFYEPGLEAALKKHLDSGRFTVATDVPAAIRQGQTLFVCVGTPQRNDGTADLSQMAQVARSIAENLNGYKLVVEKSTTPVRTAEQLKRTISRYAANGAHFDVAVNPEFLREGSALADFLNPQRVVLGVESETARDLLTRIYQPLRDRIVSEEPQNHWAGGNRILVTDLNTAELIKHASNAFLAMKISFINKVADLCEAVGADVTQVAQGIGLDPRIGPDFLAAGVGYGGYCLPKDLRAFVHIAEERGIDFALLKEVARINDERVTRLCNKISQALWVVRGKVVGVLGMAFKPGTDDIREAPSLKVLDWLQREGARLRLHDPKAMSNVQRLFHEEPDCIVYCESPYEAAKGADALVLLTEWEEYRSLDLERILKLMTAPVLIDGRNVFSPQMVRGLGFEYVSVGRA